MSTDSARSISSRWVSWATVLLTCLTVLMVPRAGRADRPGKHPRPSMTLAQAPPALQRAVGRAIGITSSPGTWSEQAELNSSDGVANDYFGSAVAISGSTAVVGDFVKN